MKWRRNVRSQGIIEESGKLYVRIAASRAALGVEGLKFIEDIIFQWIYKIIISIGVEDVEAFKFIFGDWLMEVLHLVADSVKERRKYQWIGLNGTRRTCNSL